MRILRYKRLIGIIFYRVAIFSGIFLFIIAACSKNKAPTASGKSFTLFNGIHYLHTPDLSSSSVHNLNLIYQSHLVSPATTNSNDLVPNTDSIQFWAGYCGGQPGVPVTLDIESWSYSPAQLDTTISRYLQVINTFKQQNDSSKIGFYGVVPKTAFVWKNIQPPGSVNYLNWENLNNNLNPIAGKVDIFFPSFYTFDTDTSGWKNVVLATLSEIKKYNRNIPVYAYVWPQYHDKTPMQFQFLDTAIWDYELQTLYPLIDGVVIWTSNKSANGQIISWDRSIAWWQTTLAFIKRHQIK